LAHSFNDISINKKLEIALYTSNKRSPTPKMTTVGGIEDLFSGIGE